MSSLSFLRALSKDESRVRLDDVQQFIAVRLYRMIFCMIQTRSSGKNELTEEQILIVHPEILFLLFVSAPCHDLPNSANNPPKNVECGLSVA